MCLLNSNNQLYIIHTTYRWLSELESVRAIETESKYKHHAAILNERLSTCDDLLSTIDRVFSLFDDLKAGQKAVSGRTAALHVVCENLVKERNALLSTIDALQQKLSYFDVLDKIPGQFQQSLSIEDSAAILSSLEQLDHSVAFIADHPHYADAPTYSVKLKQLQSRVLSALRTKVQQSMKNTAHSVTSSTSHSTALFGGGHDGADDTAPGPDGSISKTTTSVEDGGAESTSAEDNTRESNKKDGEGDPLHHRSSSKNNTSAAADIMMQYVRYRAGLDPALKTILMGLQERSASNQDYAKLLRDCYAMHCEVRLSLTKGPVLAHLKSQRGHALPAVLRAGCSFLLHIAQLEIQIFEQLFPLSSPLDTTTKTPASHQQQVIASALAPLMDSLCSMLYDMLRPGFVALRNVDELCDLASIVRREVLEDSVPTAENEYHHHVLHHAKKQQHILGGTSSGGGGSGSSGMLLGGKEHLQRSTASLLLDPVMRRCVADVQEKIAFRSHGYLRENISGFVPGNQDLEYPACLMSETGVQQAATGDASDGNAGAPDDPAASTTTTTSTTSTTSTSHSLHTEGWYPPIQRALHLLARLYQELPADSFVGLAHEAIVGASAAVRDAARLIAGQQQQQQQRPPVSATAMVSSLPQSLHAQLFSVKQLLTLREGIAPFHADYSVIERDLDFAQVRESLQRTVAGRLPLFSFSSRNAVVQLMSSGAPRLAENQSDARRDLDRQLKLACEAVIMDVTKMAVEPVLTFLTKVTAVTAMMLPSPGESGREDAQQVKALKDHAFASVERVAEVVAAMHKGVGRELVDAAAALKLYLPSVATQDALLKPIKANVVEAHDQLSRLIEKEYSREEASLIGLMDRSALDGMLSGL